MICIRQTYKTYIPTLLRYVLLIYFITFHLTLFSLALGPNGNLFSAHKPKNLTPSLLKTRQRFETVSAGSITTDAEDCVSPLWEFEEVSNINPRFNQK